MKKIVVIGVIALFVGVSFTGITNSLSMNRSKMQGFDGNILYVGGNGSGNYTTIQGAINDANPGDTIFVYKGTYSVFTADKKLTIIGESREETIVKANEIKLKGSDINLTNFTLKGKTENLDNVLIIRGNNCNVSYCTIVPTGSYSPLNGIEVGWCSYTNISNCDIIGFNSWAITLADAYKCYIENCTIAKSYRGIFTLFDRNHGFYAYNCELYNCGWSSPHGASIFISQSGRNKVINCNIHDNAKGIDISGSNYNEIIGCNIYDNRVGCNMLSGRPSRNKIILNNISNNKQGINNKWAGNNNYIYHNNFVGNTQFNGYNEDSLNFWDNGYPSGGNYWDDYNGIEIDGDGIGDTPYNISGGDNKDWYPLIEPYGNLRSNNNGPYYNFINKSLQFNGLVWGGNPPYTWFWTFGDGNTSVEQNPNHTYANVGKHVICLSVTDEHGNTSAHASWANIQETNVPPSTPTINGPTYGEVGNYYNYTFVSEDFDENEVWFYIEWGDGQKEEWIGPYASEEVVTISHKWSKRGTFVLRAKARDGYKNESDWATLEVTMPRNKSTNNVLFYQFLEQFPLLQKLLLLIK